MAKSILQTVDHALSVLELLAQSPKGMTQKQIADALQLNKVTVHRLLSTLVNRGFVSLTPEKCYTIGLKTVEISSLKLNSLELKTEAHPLIQGLALRVSQPVQLAIREGRNAIYIDKVDPVISIRMYSQIGKQIPLYCSSVGKALLLDKTDDEIERILKGTRFERLTPTTLGSVQAVLDDVMRARATGYTVDNAEHEPGIFCIAAPVYDYTGRIIAAISTAGAYQGFLHNVHDAFISELKNTAQQISLNMGYFPR